MRLSLTLLIILTVVLPSKGAAEEICWPGEWAPPSAGLSERTFILGGPEGLQTARASNYTRLRGRGEVMLFAALQTLDLLSLAPDVKRGRLVCDSPYQGEILIDRVRMLGPDHPYIAFLAANQIRVLSNCNRPRNAETAMPERRPDAQMGQSRDIAIMAGHDFDYLAGVALFHAGRFEEARAAFAAVAEDAASPHRNAGRLMEIRTLRKLGSTDEAYLLAKRYRREAEGGFKVALDKQEDIIAQYSPSTDYAAVHLEKVFRRVAGLPISGEKRGFRVQQAKEDLDLYFMNEFARLSDRGASDLPHDWWLRDEPPKARRAFLAVHELAGRYDGIDWVQAYHASVAFDRDNTWFSGPDLVVDDPTYDRVTDHAYKKWKNGAPRWAMIVAERMTPASGYVSKIKAYTDELREKAASCALSPVDYSVYARIAHHVVRVSASAADYETAFETLSALNRNRLYPSFEGVLGTNRALAKLLMIRGEYELIERLENALSDLQSQSRYYRRRVSATARPGALWIARTPEMLAGAHPDYFMTMLNMISSESLEAFLRPAPGRAVLRYANAARASEVLWTRGFVFGDEAQMARAEPFLLRHHPRLKRYFRHAAAAATPEARDFARAVMVLRNPGLTPYFDNVRAERQFNIAAFDRTNPIEGNWWCDAGDRAHVLDNEDRIRTSFFDQFFAPRIYRRTLEWRRISRAGYAPGVENASLDEAWRRFRSEYGPFEIISEDEQKRLAALPRASQWLAEKVRDYIESPAGAADRRAPRDERIPESLHRIVDATRYACHTLERGNATPSRWAYETLHRYYGDTVWAAETPYWYDSITNRSVRLRPTRSVDD